jgi:prepilin-type N-terminal cleavage/methylation domain-containing protein
MPPTISKKGFTLIELVMAVSILSIGVVLVLRSFLSSSGALNVIGDRLSAIEILEGKVSALKEDAFAGALKEANTNDQVDLNNRKASYNLQINKLNSDDKETNIKEVRLGLSWQEDNKGQEEILATYIENKKAAS